MGLAVGLVSLRTRLRAPIASVAVLSTSFVGLFVLRNTSASELGLIGTSKLTAIAVSAVVILAAAVWFHRVLDGRGIRRMPPLRVAGSIGATVALVVVVLGAWEPIVIERVPARQGAKNDAPNVIMILVDALRWDHLSTFGYGRETSPNIDRLADEGVAFTRAYAHGNRTIIATPALFTSMYPAFHGAVGFFDHVVPLPESRVTMAEMFQSNGYSTVGMMSNIYLKTPFNLTQGFDGLEEFNDRRFLLSVYRTFVAFGFLTKPSTSGGVTPNATEVTDAAIDWLGHLPRDNPFFFYVHYMDVHHPYLPPPEYERMFRTSAEVDAIDGEKLYAKTTELVKDQPPIDFSDDELARLIDLYDGCIRYTDAEIGRFMDTVRAMDSDRETIVIFTADHGDEFMEHGTLYHMNVVIEQLIRVPLIIWRSGDISSRRVDEMVRHIDVLPTVADLAGIDAPAQAMGKSLVRAMDGTGTLDIEESIAEGDFCAALIRPGWKIMRVDTSGAEYLFDLTHDPAGMHNVAGEYPEIHAELRARLDEYLTAAERLQKSGGSNATAEMIRQLKALGYIN